MIGFSILITTRDRAADLRTTLEALAPLLKRKDVECTVCDDGSTDETSSVLKSFPQVTAIVHPQSLGYLASRNELLASAKGVYAISLDDDAHFLSKDPLGEIEHYFADHQKCGAIAFRIFWGSNPPASQTTSYKPTAVRSFVGCGHAWRMESWRAIRPYPEWFEFYGEEEFASLELLRRDLEVHYLPSVLVHHRVNMEERKNAPDFKTRYRRSLRSGFYLKFLFYPGTKSWKHFLSSLWSQASSRILQKPELAAPLLGALADLANSVGTIAKHQKKLTHGQYQKYMSLSPAVIYWKPESEK